MHVLKSVKQLTFDIIRSLISHTVRLTATSFENKIGVTLVRNEKDYRL